MANDLTLPVDSRPGRWSLWPAVLRPGCFLEPGKGWEMLSHLVSAPVGWPGTSERRGGRHWSRVSSEGVALWPGVSGQAVLRSQDGIDCVKRPVQRGSCMRQLPSEPGAL